MKHQAKINTAINSNSLKLLRKKQNFKTWKVYFTKMYKLKIVYKIIFVIRRSLPEVFYKKNEAWSKPTGEQKYRSASWTNPLCNFIKITHTHRHTPKNPQHIHRTPSSRRTPLGLRPSACQSIFKRLELKRSFICYC